MPKPIRRIAILTSGGDAPGLNAVIRSVVKTAVLRHDWEVIGILDGFEGLIGPLRARPLTLDDVAGLLPRGGSILGCTSRGHLRTDAQGGYQATRGTLASVAAAIPALGADALIVVGGDGSHRIANELVDLGVPLVGIPKTIDNDLPGTETTFGFDSAVTFATEAIDRLHTTAESHGRVMVVEVMGREAGWIALHAGIAGGADVILIPEIPYRLERAAGHIAARAAAGKRFSIVVAAEGALALGTGPHDIPGDSPGGGRAGARAGVSGPGCRLASELALATGKETRTVVLGHLQRGGSPTATDRLLASAFGAAAVGAIADGRFGQMVAWRGDGNIQLVPIAECVTRPRTVPAHHPLLATARGLGISFAGEEDPA